jgi:hypothetical protein
MPLPDSASVLLLSLLPLLFAWYCIPSWLCTGNTLLPGWWPIRRRPRLERSKMQFQRPFYMLTVTLLRSPAALIRVAIFARRTRCYRKKDDESRCANIFGASRLWSFKKAPTQTALGEDGATSSFRLIAARYRLPVLTTDSRFALHSSSNALIALA